ncbi:hypothetical protein BC826DRAFT_1166588 [Russula brevipes]|nr:hypothetical protein BC826DRAFT_1166588 [Russula brevipes]
MASSKLGAPKRVSKKLLGRTDTEKALWTLDKLTQEEARVASAQGLWAMEHVNSRVKRVRGDVQCVGVNVQDVDERVKGADDRIRGVNDQPCLPRFRQLSVDSVRYPYARTWPFWAILTIACTAYRMSMAGSHYGAAHPYRLLSSPDALTPSPVTWQDRNSHRHTYNLDN